MEYPKIETLLVRDEATHKVKPGEPRLPEVGLIKEWLVTEKIDGMNIRVLFDTGPMPLDEPPGDILLCREPYVSFAGRTDAADLPKHLLAYLTETFTIEKLQQVFDPGTTGILFGEGYGEKIQSGGKYRQGVAFRLFDVVVFSKTGRPWWLEWENVQGIAEGLGIKTVPILWKLIGGVIPSPVCDLENIVDAVREGYESIVAQDDYESDHLGVLAEGVVARTHPLLLRRDGSRLLWKLKTKDF